MPSGKFAVCRVCRSIDWVASSDDGKAWTMVCARCGERFDRPLRESEGALVLLRDAHDALTNARARVGGTALGSDVLDTADRLAAFLALAVQR